MSESPSYDCKNHVRFLNLINKFLDMPYCTSAVERMPCMICQLGYKVIAPQWVPGF